MLKKMIVFAGATHRCHRLKGFGLLDCYSPLALEGGPAVTGWPGGGGGRGAARLGWQEMAAGPAQGQKSP